MNQPMNRKDFLKKGLFGMLGLAVAAKVCVTDTTAATVTDNLGSSGGGICVGTVAPANKKTLWIDTSNGGRGVSRYWNGSTWSATASVWDS